MAAEDAAPADAKEQKKSSHLKTILLVAAILGVEAAVVVGGLMFIAGPADVEASSSMMSESDVAGDERIVETLVLQAKLPNSRTGVTYLYDTEIYVQTQEKHAAVVQQELEQFHNEIRAAISAIWRTAEPHHFQEPNLESLTRNVHEMLSKRFGSDIETSEPVVRKCVIVMGTGFRIDG